MKTLARAGLDQPEVAGDVARLGRTLDRTEPMYGASSGAPAWPLRQWCMASKWLLMLPTCVIDRMRRNAWPAVARRVCSSLSRMPGTARGDGLVGAADSLRRVGLQVPGVEVAGPAAQPEEDARLLGRPATEWSIAAGGNQCGKAHAQRADAAELQKFAARELVIRLELGIEWTNHERLLSLFSSYGLSSARKAA